MATEWRQGTKNYKMDHDFRGHHGELVAWVRPENGQYVLRHTHPNLDDTVFPTLEAAKLAAEVLYA